MISALSDRSFKIICLFLSPFYDPSEIVSHKSLRSLSLTVYVPNTNKNRNCYPMNVQCQAWGTEKNQNEHIVNFSLRSLGYRDR